MRDRLQLELTPREYLEAKRLERKRILEELRVELARARMRRAPWLVWLEKRWRGEHDHDCLTEDGKPAACPVAGCDARRGAP